MSRRRSSTTARRFITAPPVASSTRTRRRKLELYAKMIACYEKFIELFDEAPVERVEIPFENGKTIPGILQTVPGVPNAPLRHHRAGDGHHQGVPAEPLPQPLPAARPRHAQHRRTRPGGEQHARDLGDARQLRARGVPLPSTFSNPAPRWTPSKIGLYGWSMGSYWGPRVAAHDKRLKACVGAMGVYLQKDSIFKPAESPPTARTTSTCPTSTMRMSSTPWPNR